MKLYTFLFILLLSLLVPAASTANTGPTMTMAEAAAGMAQEMDAQLSLRFGQQQYAANGITVIVTTPVDINNFEESSVVARQMQESISHWLVQAGYSVQEVRRGKSLLFRQDTGELLLTRNRDLAAQKTVKSSITLVGTYTVTSKSIIFNIRMMQTGGSEVYAMSSMSIPVTGEIRAMLSQGGGSGGSTSVSYMIEPSVYSRLP